MDKIKLLALINSIQQYGQQAELSFDLHNNEHEESFRDGWYSGLAELKEQLTKQP